MTLTPPRLDDLTFDTLTEAARLRIPAESGGEWTLHAPVDPGVTLLELFAYLLEQRGYRLDQVPDELVVAMLRLLGVDPPRGARAAATVLQVDAGGTVLTVPAGTVLTRDPAERILFTLDDEVTVVPLAPDGVRLLVDGADRTADLTAGRGVAVPAPGHRPAGRRHRDGGAEFAIALRPADGISVPAGTRLRLLFEIGADASVPPSWSPDAVADVPPPADLTWTWDPPRTTTGRPGTDADVDDGTGGLRRSGIVTVTLPAPARSYVLRVRAATATHATPPVLLAVVPNAGAARHVRTLTAGEADLGTRLAAWLRLPGQRLTLPGAAGLLLDATLRLRRDGRAETWRAAPAFTFAGPRDRLFLLDRATGELVFGDGLTGAVPVPDPVGGAGARPDHDPYRPPAPVIEVEYLVGGGTGGNGGMTANWYVPVGTTDDEAVAAVVARNVVPAHGGRDPETTGEARRRAGEELGGVHRAVTAADFEELATTTPGVAVARAHAAIGAHPGYPGQTVPGAVTVHVVPAAPRTDAGFADSAYRPDPRPDPGLLAAVRGRLGGARLIGTEVFVCPPRYRTVRLRVDLAAEPSDPAAIRDLLRAALRRHLDPVVGGDDGAGWPFGAPLRPSGLLRAVLAAAGTDADPVAVAIGIDGAEPDGTCTDAPLRPGELPALASVTVRATGTGTGATR